MVKVVVAGGAGFMESYISESLAYQGYRGLILDDLSIYIGIIIRRFTARFTYGLI